MPSRQRGLPEIEKEARKSNGGWERVITKRGQDEREFKDEGSLGKKSSKEERPVQKSYANSRG